MSEELRSGLVKLKSMASFLEALSIYISQEGEFVTDMQGDIKNYYYLTANGQADTSRSLLGSCSERYVYFDNYLYEHYLENGFILEDNRLL